MYAYECIILNEFIISFHLIFVFFNFFFLNFDKFLINYSLKLLSVLLFCIDSRVSSNYYLLKLYILDFFFRGLLIIVIFWSPHKKPAITGDKLFSCVCFWKWFCFFSEYSTWFMIVLTYVCYKLYNLSNLVLLLLIYLFICLSCFTFNIFFCFSPIASG